jgi:predicted dehydrogenase
MGLTRRRFLEDSLLAAAAAAYAGAPLPAGASTRRAGPNERLRVGMVGVKGQGRVHVGKYLAMPDVEVAAICDPDPNVVADAMNSVEKKTGKKPEHHLDLRKMLEDKSLDIISIAAPNHWHVLASIWAIQAGKDVYVEKPLGHNVWEQRKLVEASRKHEKIVQMGNYTRSLGSHRSAMEYLRSGKLGKVKLARGLCYNKRGSIGKKPDGAPPPGVDYNLWLGPAPERPFNPNRFHYNWHWNFEFGGGEIANNGIYYLDVARWGLGKSEHPKKVISIGGRLGYEDDGNTPNTQVGILDYGDVQIVIEIRGLETQPYMDVTMGNVFHCEKGYLASGIRGTAAFSPEGQLLEKFTGPGDHFRNFIDAVKSRRRESLNSEVLEGHLSTTLCHLPNISHRLGEPKPLSELPAVGGDAGAETLDRMRAHLKENGLDPSRTLVHVGPSLEFDGAAEKFVGNPAADALLRREYRKPFVVPETV